MPRTLSIRVGYSVAAGAITHGRDLTTANTGLEAAGVTVGSLTTYSGPTTITTPGTVIDSKNIGSQLVVDVGAGNTATITKCYVSPGTNNSHAIEVKSGTLNISYTEVAKAFSNCLAATGSGKFVGNRLKLHGSEDGVILNNNSELYESYIYGLTDITVVDQATSTSHFDGVNGDGYVGWTVQRCRVENNHNQTSVISVGYNNNTSSGMCADNYFAGGGWTMYAGAARAAGQGITVSGCDFDAVGYTAVENGAALPVNGHVTGWVTANNTWTNNRVRVNVSGTPTWKTLNSDNSVA